MMYRNDITSDFLKSVLTYLPSTGEFIWKNTKGRKHVAGCVAGNKSVWGYTEIRLNRKLYKAHRLAWLYSYGEWPLDAIDHIDGDRSNNRLLNLRSASYADNNQNMAVRRTSKSGSVGVSYDSKRHAWVAQLNVGGKRVLHKRCATREEAERAYTDAKAQHHEFQPFHRQSVLVVSTKSKQEAA
jgi:hypothetical protein